VEKGGGRKDVPQACVRKGKKKGKALPAPVYFHDDGKRRKNGSLSVRTEKEGKENGLS